MPEPGANCRHSMFLKKKVLVFLDGMQATEKEINIGPDLIADMPDMYRTFLVAAATRFCELVDCLGDVKLMERGTSSGGLGTDDAGRRVQGLLL